MAKPNPLLSLRPTVTEEAELVAQNAAQPAPATLESLVAQFVKLRTAVQTTQSALDRAEANRRIATEAIDHLSPEATDEDRKPIVAAFHAAEDGHTKAIEAHLVATSEFEQAMAAVVPAARAHYAEQIRDKRSEDDLACPSWAPTESIMVDPNNTSQTTRVTYTEGCKCMHMRVRHDKPEENPWCSVCQAAHTDGSQPHTFVTEEQFINRILTNAS